MSGTDRHALQVGVVMIAVMRVAAAVVVVVVGGGFVEMVRRWGMDE